MKKLFCNLFVVLIALASFSLVSCGDDDNNLEDDVINASIVGTWEVTYLTIDCPFETDSNVQIGDRLTFYSNGTYKDPVEMGRWEIKEKTLILDSEASEGEVSVPLHIQITKLTAEDLHLIHDNEPFLRIEWKCKRISE